jgi:serine/threonine-protein kinase RsbW
LDADADRFGAIAEALSTAGFIKIEAGNGRLADDVVVADFIDSRHRLHRTAATPAAVKAHIITKAIERAPRLMEGIYRAEAGVGLEDLLLRFDLQDVPAALLDYRAFRESYKGLPESEVTDRLGRDDQTVPLPQISHAAGLPEMLPAVAFSDADRVVVGVGFADRAYRPEDRTVWLCAEIESKLEAEAELTETWLNRLGESAAQLGYEDVRFWLISPEGFSNEGLGVLEERGAFGSSRQQAEFLRGFLDPDAATTAADVKEYEMVIPAGDEAELISAHSLEEIARRHEFPAKAVNQIKTALVEACINASEHGLSPDRKIYQKFAVDPDKIVITISNRGIRMRPRADNANQTEAGERTGRRGWGLELIRRLMDEVRVEQVDDGTRILMTKYLRSGEAAA